MAFVFLFMPMYARWNPNLSNLRDYLADKFPSAQEALRYAQSAGLRVAMLQQPTRPIDMWHEVLDASLPKRFGTLEALFEALLRDLPGDPTIMAARNGSLTDLSSGVRMTDVQWQGDASTIQEKIIGSESTLLPISFLEHGLKAARPVAKVLITAPDGIKGSGTGFLLGKRLLVTNHHVLPDQQSASACRCLFDYRYLENGLLSEGGVEVAAEEDTAFFTSEADDLSVVRLGPGVNERWGELTLSAQAPARLSSANIIQHPGGRPKEIALYHNFVVFADSDRVQYLTDTEPGSSGSPVFDNQWKVIAIHHSGGRIPEPGTGRKHYRNEGVSAIRLKRLLDGWDL